MYLLQWMEQFKEPRTEIKKLNDKYYKYEVKYVYNKDKKRTEKKTVHLLGRINEDSGFILSDKDKLRRNHE